MNLKMYQPFLTTVEPSCKSIFDPEILLKKLYPDDIIRYREGYICVYVCVCIHVSNLSFYQ